MATTLAQLPPRTLADQNRRAVVITEPAESLQGLSATLLNGAQVIDASCRVTQANTRISATASETINEAAVCEEANTQTLGASNYEGSIESFRFFDPDEPGQADPEGDALFQAIKVKGTEVIWVERHSNKKWDEPFAAGDEYTAYRIEVDNWQKSADQHTGYIKATHPVTVKAAEQNGVVGAGTGGGEG